MADNIEQLYGDYGSDVLKQFAKTPREGLMPLADNVTFAAGCTGNQSTLCQVLCVVGTPLFLKLLSGVLSCLNEKRRVFHNLRL